MLGGFGVLVLVTAFLGFRVSLEMEKRKALEQRIIVYEESVKSAEQTIKELQAAREKVGELYNVAREAQEAKQRQLNKLSLELRRLANEDPEIPKWGETAMPESLYSRLLDATRGTSL